MTSPTKEEQRNSAKEALKFGLETSIKNKLSLTDVAPQDLDLAWSVRTRLPFSWNASKNAFYGRIKGGNRLFIRQESRAYRNAITLLIRRVTKDIVIRKAKLWLDIYVEKPSNKGDAINVIDLVCDAIKDAIPLDDRWYAIRRLDWSINKDDPQLFIGLSQEFGVEDSKACRFCGSIKPWVDFGLARDQKDGRGSECKSCRLRVSEEDLAKYPNRRTWR